MTRVERRGFLMGTLAFLAAPLAVGGQTERRVYHIGMLERTSPATNAANVDGFREGLRALGYAEGKHFVIEYRSAEGHDERFPELAADLARLKVDFILARGTPAVLAAKNVSGTIPVIITGVGDPVAQGIVVSLARPGANVTGLSPVVTETYPKRVELLTELVPKARRIAALFNMGKLGHPTAVERGGGGGAVPRPRTPASRRASCCGSRACLRCCHQAACGRTRRRT